MTELVDEWLSESREIALRCDPNGTVIDADRRARARLSLDRGASFARAAAPGVEEKARALVARGLHEVVVDSELPLLVEGRACTFSFRAKPDGKGNVLLLGTSLPDDHARMFQQVDEAMRDVIDLNREVGRQKRELERQNERLAATNRELDDSNRGVLSLHAELEENAAALKRMVDVRGRVVADVSHELRTPLHTILGLSRLLLDEVDGSLAEEQRKQVRYIRTSAEELKGFVDDLLDLSKAESGKAQLRFETFVAEDLFAVLRGQLRPLVPDGHPVELSFDAPTEASALQTDQGKVAQVLRNLVSNALKFTEAGSIRVSCEVIGEDIAFHVADTGLGIASEDIDRIFEEFGQIDSAVQRRVKGTGLGLSLSRRLAELLSGALTVKSALGRGSTFTLRIPRVHPEVREFTDIVSRPLDPTKAPVLVVEDDRKTIFVYERYLAMTGFQVMPARTIADARELLRAHRPSAIVLDVMLEGETSWDFLAELKRDPATSDIPVLVVTVTSKAEKARALGADEFWLKPVDQARLHKKLASLAKGGASTKLLVIDDDERSRYLVRRLLVDTPYALTEASTGAEGIAAARDIRPDVILLDFLLHEMTAFDVLDELKADPATRGIPVIVVTSQALDATQRGRLAAETEAILSKETLSREVALNRIRDALRNAGVGER